MKPNGPGPNNFFDSALATYARLNTVCSQTSNTLAPRCYSYIKLSLLPQEVTGSRPLFRSKKHIPAVYTDFLYHDPSLTPSETYNAHQEKAWRRYFENKTGLAKYVLQGLVMEELSTAWYSLEDSSFWLRGLESWSCPPSGPDPTVVARKIKDSLEFMHGVGVLHGDAQIMENIWLCGDVERGEKLRVIWIDFSPAVVGEKADVVFCRRLKRELKRWRREVKELALI